VKRWLVGGALALAVGIGALTMPSTPPPPPAFDLSAGGGSCEAGGSLQVSQPASGALSAAAVAKAGYSAGFRGSDLIIFVAVAHAESGWKADARNENSDGSVDYGLLQINSVHAAILAGGTWFDAKDNAVMARSVWEGAGSSWSPWVTYWRGTYRQWMGEATSAVAGITDAVQAVTGCDAVDLVSGDIVDPGAGPQGADGLTPRAEAVKSATTQKWGCRRKAAPCVSYIGGYARRNIAGTGTLSDHATGNADDIMLPSNYRAPAANALGWEIAKFWRANAKAAGIKYVIFDSKIWAAGDRDWQPYTHPGCGGDVCQHVNHVHVSVLS
jgi:hypothetical protein